MVYNPPWEGASFFDLMNKKKVVRAWMRRNGEIVRANPRASATPPERARKSPYHASIDGESEALLSAVMKQLPVGLGVMDTNGQWVISNAIMNEFVPKGIPSVVSEHENRWRAYDEDGHGIPTDDWPSQRALRGEVVQGLEMIFTDDDGRNCWMRVSAAPLLNDAGTIIGATVIVQDITEHKRIEEVVRASEERLRTIIDQANAGIARYDRRGRIRFANPRLCKMLGYLKSELEGKTVLEITHAGDIERTKDALERAWRKGAPTEIDKRYIRKDRSILWVNVCDSVERNGADQPKFIVAVAVDITTRKKAEAALEKSKELLEKRVHERTRELHVANKELKSEIGRRRGLEGEILAVSDREQQRLGQELHDGICQHLTAVAFMARSVALRLRNHRVIDAADIEKIAELVNNAAADTRNLSRALHRIDIDAAGLANALQDLVDREIWRIPCRLEVKPSFHIDDDAAAAHLYRIAREAVINANKHAQARKVVVRLERSPQGMVLRVTDDGVGLSSEPKLKQGLGFHIMNYRAQLMGARLEIDSPKGAGTCVSCYLPGGAPRLRKSHKREREWLARPILQGKSPSFGA